MSLINKMLRDLDARHATTGQTAMPDEVRPLPEQIVPPPRIGRGVWGFIVLAVIAEAGLQTSDYWLPQIKAWLAPTAAAPPPAPRPLVRAQAPGPVPAPVNVPPLPSVTDTLPPPPEPPPELAQAPVPAPPEPAPQVAAAAPAEVRNSGLKIDRSLPQLAAAQPQAPVAQPPAPVVAERPRLAPAPRSAPAPARVVIDRVQGLGTAQGRAEAEYRRGVAAFKLGHATEAVADFKAALQEDPRHVAARQTLLSMMAEQKRWDEAQTLLSEGLALMPTQVSWAIALARIQVQLGNTAGAWETLQRYMAEGEKNADYQGFAGVLLQRLQKPHEAIARYQAALQLKPNEARWWLGLGLALESDGRAAEAREAFLRARGGDGLTPEMLAVIEQKLH